MRQIRHIQYIFFGLNILFARFECSNVDVGNLVIQNDLTVWIGHIHVD